MARPASTGLILCGGASRRMGSDKALLVLGRGAPRTLLERAAARLGALCDEVVLACGAAPRHAGLGLRLALDRAPGLGPLAGLEAGLAAARAPLVLAVAVDMPRLDEAPLEALLETLAASEADACLPEGPRGLEPLCGAWRRSALGAVRAALDAGERRVLAAFDAERLGPRAARLERLRVPSSGWAENVNTPEELAAHAAGGGR